GGLARGIAKVFKPVHALFFNKYYIDELYNRMFVLPSLRLGRFFSVVGDQKIINGFGPDGFAKRSQSMAKILSHVQSGYVYHYAFVMILGLVAAITWIFYKMVVPS